MQILWERIMETALQRSFFYPSNEPYGSTSGFYDYGPTGVLLKKKIENLWRKTFIYDLDNLEVESAIITPEIVLKASGHVDNFTDPIVECKKCGKKIRADHLAEEKIAGFKWDGKFESLKKVYLENKERMLCSCGAEIQDLQVFNLMFKTGIGAELTQAYSRPETAQGIFTSFSRLFKNHGSKLPLGIGQVGKSFRNEISPRNVLIRMREFTQMELEYFFNPSQHTMQEFEKVKNFKIKYLAREGQKGSDRKVKEITAYELVQKGICDEIFAFFLVKEWEYYNACGLNIDKCTFRHLLEGETPHYSKGNIDMEIETSYGIIETIGNAYRTDFDLTQHQNYSKKDFAVFVEEEKKKVIPHVFELSMGVDRMLFAVLEHTFREKNNEKDWEWFDFPPAIAPYEAGVFPLMKKDGLAEKGREVAAMLRKNLSIFYSERGSIGRRYAKADEIGIPYAITIDYETLENKTVTIRYRNDGKQERVSIFELEDKIKKNVAEGKVTLV